jgi:hypothetical protein
VLLVHHTFGDDLGVIEPLLGNLRASSFSLIGLMSAWREGKQTAAAVRGAWAFADLDIHVHVCYM